MVRPRDPIWRHADLYFKCKLCRAIQPGGPRWDGSCYRCQRCGGRGDRRVTSIAIPYFKCNSCRIDRAGSATRIKEHLRGRYPNNISTFENVDPIFRERARLAHF